MAVLGLDTTREGQSPLIADARPVVEGDGLPALGEGIVQQEGIFIALCAGVAYARSEPDIQPLSTTTRPELHEVEAKP